MWVNMEVINKKTTGTVQKITDLQVIKNRLWDQIRMQAQLHAKKNSKYKEGGKRHAGPKIEKETRGENGVTGGGCVISLIASTETGNGAVTHRK